MKSFIILLTVLIYATSICISQDSFDSKLKELNQELNLKNYIKLVDNFRSINQIELNNCLRKLQFHRTLGKFYFRNYMDEEFLFIQRDSILPLQLECLAKGDSSITVTYFNIATAYDYLGDKKMAKENYLKVADLQQSDNKTHFFESKNYVEIGYFYRQQGDYEKANFYFEMAIQTYLPKTKGKVYTKILQGQARALYSLGEYSKASLKIKEAIAIAKNTSLKNNELLSYLYQDLSKSQRKLKFYNSAQESILKALALLRPIRENLQTNYNTQLRDYSYLLKSMGEYKKSIKILNEVKSYLVTNNDKISLEKISGINEDIADIYSEMGDYHTALEYYQKSIGYLVEFKPDNNYSNPIIQNSKIIDEEYLQRQLSLKLDALIKLGKTEDNLSAYNSAIEVTLKLDTLNQLLLNRNWEESTHLQNVAKSRLDYAKGTEAAVYLYKVNNQQRDIELAYNISSRYKAQLLSKGIDINAKKKNILSDSLIEVEKTINQKINEKESVYKNQLNKNNPIELSNSFSEFFKEKVNLENFYIENKIWEKIDYKDIRKTQSVNQIQELLKPQECLLEFLVTDDLIHSYLISKNEIHYSSLDLQRSEILNFYSYLTSESNKENTGSINQLTKILENINTEEIDILYVIPDQELLQIPFESLKLNEKYLINLFDISYNYNSSFLNGNSKNKGFSSSTIFGCDYKGNVFKNDTLFDNVEFGELDFSQSEAELVYKEVGGKLYINNQATKEKFKDSANNSSILHLALHSKLDHTHPDQSALVFHSDQNDYYLTASEIYDLEINTDLTVLSACNSSIGKLYFGDGLRSLTRSFIHSGSESVIASLWDAPDLSTSKILKSFYHELKNGNNKSSALRKAKLDYIENAQPSFKHPKYWAHLVLVGDSGNIKFKKDLFSAYSNSIIVKLLLGAILISILILTLKKFLK